MSSRRYEKVDKATPQLLSYTLNRSHENDALREPLIRPRSPAPWKKEHGMQRCPYIHEMKERLLSQSGNAAEILLMDAASKQQQPHQRDSSRQRELHSRRESHGPYHNHPQSQSQLLHESTGIETVVKLNSDGFGSHTLPILECQRQRHNFKYFPKNAKADGSSSHPIRKSPVNFGGKEECAALESSPVSAVDSSGSNREKEKKKKGKNWLEKVKMVGGAGEVKVATVDVESVDNMATLPVSKLQAGAKGEKGDGPGTTSTIEKNNAANKEAEAKKQRAQIKQPPARTSQFIFLSFIYAKLLIVMCIAYVLSEVITHKLPVECYEDNNCTSSTYSFMESKETVYKRRIEFNFYINNFLEGFFTYLYGVSIFFLLYVFCFLLQESSCCQGNSEPKPVKQKKVKEKKVKEKEKAEKKAKEKEEKAKEKEREKEKKKEEKEKKKDKKKEKDPKDGGGAGDTQPPPAGKEKTPAEIPQPNKKQSNLFQGVVTTAMKKEKGLETPSQDSIHEYEPSPPVVVNFGRKRKTSQNNQSHGSFFLRVGAIAFGLGTMIYNGLEFGVFFETPFHSPCYQILKGINPVLQMIFTFMQMYFIFMNSRLNIHRFKVVARFGLMHIVATNLCVWIRTLVLESIKEYDLYMSKHNKTMLPTVHPTTVVKNLTSEFALFGGGSRINQMKRAPVTFAPATTLKTTAKTLSTMMSKIMNVVSTTPTTVTIPTEATTNRATTPFSSPSTLSTASVAAITASVTTPTPSSFFQGLNHTLTTQNASQADSFISSTTPTLFKLWNNENQTFAAQNLSALSNASSTPKFWDTPVAEALVMLNGTYIDPTKCGRVNIMGNIVRDSAPYLYPFIVEYSLIGAAVIYIMWKHIGRWPKYTEEDLEQRLEAMLSRRAIAMAQATTGRMDCVGASKGLFFGLLLLVGSLICLILFFVLIHHPQLGLLAIYLADVSHCAIMGLSILAILIGFWRVRRLKYYYDEGNSLNDLLQRVSAFGIFVYAMFSVIAGSLTAMTSEPNLLVMITGSLTVLQVLCQVVFISDISRRRVYLPEHDCSKPGRQIVTFLLICNITMWIIYTFDAQKVTANPVQLNFYGFLAWSMIQRITLPLSIFYRFHAAVTLAEVWKTSYKPRID